MKTFFYVFTCHNWTGFVTGDLDQDDYQLRSICVELQVVVVNVGYRQVEPHSVNES